MNTKIVSRTAGLIAGDTTAFKGEEVILFGRNDRTIAHIDANGTITPYGIGIIVDDIVQSNFNAPITEYPSRYAVMRRVAQSVANAAGAPGNTASGGVISTFRMSDDTFSYQEWRRAFETTIYRRVWDNVNNTWGTFA